MKSPLGLLIAVAFLLGAAACDSTEADPETRLVLDPCPPEDRIPDGLCGRFNVFEDRDSRTGRRIDLKVVVLPALAGTPEPDPVFVLAGGPGQAATEIIGAVLSGLRDVHRNRDLVFVDQRGTGDSNPLGCDLSDEDDPQEILIDPMVDASAMERTLGRLATCVDSLNADTRLYTTPIAMDDLNDVRAALGYERINLWGVSYGTRAALVFMRRHPDHVRSAVLDGLAPQAIRLPLHLGRDSNRALDILLSDCEASAVCNAAFPRLEERLESLLSSVDERALGTTVLHPRTGTPTDVGITRASIASVIRTTLYNPYLSALLPLALDDASRGRFEPLATLSLGAGGNGSGIALGMYLSVVCAEDMPFITEEDRREAEQDRLFGMRLLENFTEMCEVWPAGQVPASYTEPVSSMTPVLLLSGNLDPITPPVWAELAAQTLPNATHIIVPGSAHNVFSQGCLPDLIDEFIRSASAEDIDASCAEDVERPSFFDTPLGPSLRGPQ
ncbi:MAG: alpha/beta hydrolase [Gemmatimonadota bacterium]|nr:alpha/beta hydrolase [Gemmatimonadota bacterium]